MGTSELMSEFAHFEFEIALFEIVWCFADYWDLGMTGRMLSLQFFRHHLSIGVAVQGIKLRDRGSVSQLSWLPSTRYGSQHSVFRHSGCQYSCC